jgi:hypothetical protein
MVHGLPGAILATTLWLVVDAVLRIVPKPSASSIAEAA